jgi:TPR repeat protein
MYGNGYTRSRDYVESYMWFEIAACNGNTTAVGNRKALRSRMTDAEVEAGMALARDWLHWHTA